MSLVLAAAGATVAGLLELTIVPHLGVGGAHPHLVLVLGVIWTVAVGVERGLIWAFVGGLVLDVLAPRPLGSTAFTMLLALGGASVGARILAPIRPLAPVVLVPVFSLMSSVALLATLSALRAPITTTDPIGALIPGVIYDTVLALVIGPLAVTLHDRRVAGGERAAW